MYKPALIAAAIFGLIAVGLGAFGAHSLEKAIAPADLVKQLGVWEKGVTYQFYHTFALLAAGMLYTGYPFRTTRLAALFFGLGILLFSGSLYLMVALSIAGATIGPVGIITPVGGLCFILGWLCLLSAFLNKK